MPLVLFVYFTYIFVFATASIQILGTATHSPGVKRPLTSLSAKCFNAYRDLPSFRIYVTMEIGNYFLLILLYLFIYLFIYSYLPFLLLLSFFLFPVLLIIYFFTYIFTHFTYYLFIYFGWDPYNHNHIIKTQCFEN
jgi:hypothetical protein